jgi:hypothetical protein
MALLQKATCAKRTGGFLGIANPDRTQAKQPSLHYHPFPYAKIRFFEPQNQGFPD